MGGLGSMLVTTAIAGVGGTGVGALVAALFRRGSGKTVSLLLSFAAGVMVSVVCFDLMADALRPDEGVGIALRLVLGGVLGGYGVIALLNTAVDRRAGRGSAKEMDGQRRLLTAGLVMAAAIALHNMPEGVVIGAAFAKDAQKAALSRSGLLMAAVIGLHNIPEGMAVATPLIAGGMGALRAVAVTAASGLPTVLGAVAGYWLGTMGPVALSLSLSFASGAMLYVVFGELLPEAISLWKSKTPALAVVVGLLVGVLLIYG